MCDSVYVGICVCKCVFCVHERVHTCTCRVTNLGSHLMSELDKQDVLITRTQTNKAYEVSKPHMYICLTYITLHVALQTCSCSQIRV